MKYLKKTRYFTIGAAICLLFCASSCGKQAVSSIQFAMPSEMNTVSSQIVAENDKFTLSYDGERQCVMMENKLTGEIWGSTPYEFYLEDRVNANMDSPIFLEYLAEDDGAVHPVKAYSSAILMENISSEKKSNGIQINFFFEEQKIMIPVTYTLRDDSVAVSIDPLQIQEAGNRVTSISLTPFFCSAKNGNEGSYLFVPSGSGALMYTDQDDSGVRNFTGEIYGTDMARKITTSPTNDIPIMLPVFGAKDGDKAILAIVESGEGAASITAAAGNRNGYSNAYTTFLIRSYDTSEVRKDNANKDYDIFTDDITVKEPLTVGYFPLSGDEADYSGMAGKFRSYLQQNGMSTTRTESEKVYGITVIGGSMIDRTFFGFPYQSLCVATDFEQATAILKGLFNDSGFLPTIKMAGFSENGLDYLKVAGGFDLASTFGSKSQMNKIQHHVTENGGSVFWDFNITDFIKSGNGFSTIWDKAKTATGHSATRYILDKSLRNITKSTKKAYLLRRSKLTQAASKLLDYAEDNGINAISLGAFGATAYSDFSDERYYSKGGMAEQTSEIRGLFSSEGIRVATTQANDYAAIVSDAVFDVPLASSGYVVFDEDIPFYQMVFKGYTELISTPVNIAPDENLHILKAVESGTSLGFVLIGDYDIRLADTNVREYYGSVFADNREKIHETVSRCRDYYDAVKGALITKHERLSDGITVTYFDNGVVVYTNQSANSVLIGDAVLKAGEFFYCGGDRG